MIPETKDRLTYDAGVAMAGVVAECRRALTTIALAAGLGADATAEEVVARVGEMREAERLLVAEVRAHAFADSFSEADRLRPTMEAFEAHIAGQRATVARLLLSRRLAEESGRDEDAAPAIVQPVGGCDGSREFAYDGSAEDGRGARLAQRCPGCRACS